MSKVPVYTNNSLNFDRIDSFNDLSFKTILPSELRNILQDKAEPKKQNPSSKFYVIADALHTQNLEQVQKTQLPKGYIAALVSPYHARDIKCIHDLRCKNIGVTDLTSYYIVGAIQNAYRIFDDEFNIYEIPSDYLTGLATLLLRNELDVIFTFVQPGSRYMEIIQRQSAAIIGFDVDKIDMQRLNLFYPEVNLVSKYLPSVFGTALVYPERDSGLLELSNYIVSFSNKNTTNTSSDQKETFISRLNLPNDDNDDTSYKYQCYGDPDSLNKNDCISPYDRKGNKRDYPTAWDTPCKTDFDCPFYDKERNRGGCSSNGICELPIGVKRIGFKAYISDSPYQPFCKECDPLDGNCCLKKKNVTYAFVGDQYSI